MAILSGGVQPATSTISVMIVDDHPFVRFSLANLLRTDARLSISGEASTGTATIELYRALCPDVLLLDLQLPDLSGTQVTRQILHRTPEARIVIFSSLPSDHDEVRAALAAGARAYVRKTADHETLLETIYKAGVERRGVGSDATTAVGG